MSLLNRLLRCTTFRTLSEMRTEKQIQEFCLDYSYQRIFNYELNSVPTGNFLNIYSHIYTQFVRQKDRSNREAQNTIF